MRQLRMVADSCSLRSHECIELCIAEDLRLEDSTLGNVWWDWKTGYELDTHGNGCLLILVIDIRRLRTTLLLRR